MEAAGEYPAEINMGLTEILLILLGILAFVASFVLPESLSKDKKAEIKIPEEKIKSLIEQEIKQAAFQIEEKTDETITAAAQKTERYMERLSNEKIMAIQEYSDTVLGQINRNHEEAVFLYDMLNNKQVQVKNAAAELNSTIQGIKVNLENTLQEQLMETTNANSINSLGAEEKKEMWTDYNVEEKHAEDTLMQKAENHEECDGGNESPIETEEDKGNKKNQILKLHEEGKTMIEIAKSLGLGIGEVKLIIGLYENEES